MEVDKLLCKAIQDNKLVEFLEGKEHMDIGNSSHFSNTGYPTEWPSIISNGFYKLYKDNPKLNVNLILEDALSKMLLGDVFEIYCAINIWYIQIENERNQRSLFELNREKFIGEIRKTLLISREKLLKYYDWDGRNEEEGMWGYIKRINECCKLYFNIEII